MLLAAHRTEKIRGEEAAEAQVCPTHRADELQCVVGVFPFHVAAAGSEAGFSPA